MRRPALVVVLLLVVAWPALTGADRQAAIDAAFARFWAAASRAEAETAARGVVRSGVGFAEAIDRLRTGRPYRADVPGGVVVASRPPGFEYAVHVPAGYDPARRHPLRVQLHGGVDSEARSARTLRPLPGNEHQFHVMPVAWREMPWWSPDQVENLRVILDRVKRRYNIDENRVTLSGISDGATGAWYVAMRDPTPYAALFPFIGFALVLNNAEIGVSDGLYLSNVRNRPFYTVNGTGDPLYPAAIVEPYVLDLARRGVEIQFRAVDAEHDIRWWPDERDDVEAFAEAHPRDPLPDRITWETRNPRTTGRVHWLVINELGETPSDTAADGFDDLNRFTPPPGLDIGLRVTGQSVTRVAPGSNADALGFRTGDRIERLGDRVVDSTVALLDAVSSYPIGAPVVWHVRRGGREVQLSGTHAPVERQPPDVMLFERRSRSGRADVERDGNRFEIRSRGVRRLTLLLAPDEIDLGRPVEVRANGRTVFEGVVEPSLETLLRWAARDNDRTMLFGAEVVVELR